jgi:hypothetical protein
MTDNEIRRLADIMFKKAEWANSYAVEMWEAYYTDAVPDNVVPPVLRRAVHALMTAAENAEIEAQKWSNFVGEPDEENPETEGDEDEEESAA